MFDLADLDTQKLSEAGAKMEVIHPKTGSPVYDDDGQPIYILLNGRNSKQYRAAMRVVQERRIDRRARNIKVTEDEARSDDFEVICACTRGWSLKILDGQPFPYSPENVRKLWNDRRFVWLFERASVFIVDDANFLAISSTDSTGSQSTNSSADAP
jgi:hypothetical protein